MTWKFLIEKLKNGGEIRYHENLTNTRYTLCWDDNNMQEQIPSKLMMGIFSNYKTNERLYAIEGSEATGWLDTNILAP